MLKITGYSDKYSICPGDDIKFYINSEYDEVYDTQIVRLIHGDTNPEGPGYKEEEISASCNKSYTGRNQRIHGGSYIVVPQDDRLNLESFTIQCYIFPTTPDKGRQGIITKWIETTGSGYGLFINEAGCLAAEIGDGSGMVTRLSSDKALLRKVWYLAALSYDARTGRVTLYQEPVVTATNGGLGQAILNPSEDTTATVESNSSVRPAINDAPLLMGASTLIERCGRSIFGAHFKEATSPVDLPEQANLYNGKIDRPRLCSKALSKAEIESLARGFQTCAAELRHHVVGAWDFHANITNNIASTYIIDVSTSRLNGHMINMPCRGMTGFNWTGDEIVYHHKPEEYGAIHFHDDDIDDARWDVDFTYTVPDNLKSGIYAARLRIGGIDSPETEDYVPFVVRPPKGKTTSKLAFILPTNSYIAYSNDNLATNCVVAELLAGKVPVMTASDLYLNEHREYGLSTYSLHSDGSGVAYSSRLRPILNMRPKYRHWLSPSLWQLNGDLHLVDWLEEKNFDFDIHTDEDLHREGVGLLNKYQTVLTGSHPEYTSEKMFAAYEQYQQDGGRWLYLGANGFYWCSEYHPDNNNIIEVRKGEAGTRAWTANPGEYNNAFDGKYGGMWRARGRIPSKLCGLTFTAYGFDVSSYYVRDKDSERPETAWIMDGVGNGERIGDFGLVGGGAAGLELDRYDLEFGTPHEAYLLAHSEAHTNLMLQVNEEIHFSVRGYHGSGTENPMVRADMIYYKTPNNGALFAPGSLSWCGSLSHNNYNNNVSKITENAIRGFLKDEELP
ncbi:MAG: N,N-dimethylformamidase [Oceanospirillaceae bacterium]|jgi:N,N-dimethylformamidase|tara:strand:+ start:18876 stop:21233 length:2358 start_codon:yes stop_codon:yes gene_type:complete